MDYDEEKTPSIAVQTKPKDNSNPPNPVFTPPSKIGYDVEALQQIGGSITPVFWEKVKGFAAEEQRFESLRTVIFSKLNTLSKQIPEEQDKWEEIDLKQKAYLIAEIQECLYDYQLVEHASQASLLQVAKIVFSFNKKRCARKMAIVKVKPAKKQKLESSLPIRDARKAERDQKSPIQPKNHTHKIQIISEVPANSSCCVSSNPIVVKEDCSHPPTIPPNKKGPRGQRKSNRDKLTASVVSLKSEVAPESPTVADHVEMVVKEETPNLDDTPDEKSQPVEKFINSSSKKELNIELRKEEPCVMQIDPTLSSPPRKRAAALAAAMSVTDTINPPRSSSPRKKNNGNSNAIEEDAQPDEPTYCLCEQVSFGDMICCDFSKCPVEWFHFSCVNIKIKPKGKKWFCPLCRGDKPTILKSSLAKK